MINPDKYIREAYISALSSATGLTVFDTGIPINMEPLPKTYIILRNQSKNPFSRDKESWEWLCSLTIDIVDVNEKGYNSSVNVDDIEGQVITIIEAGITILGFKTKFTRYVDTVSLPVETPTQTIARKVVIYEHWLNRAS